LTYPKWQLHDAQTAHERQVNEMREQWAHQVAEIEEVATMEIRVLRRTQRPSCKLSF